MITRPLLFDTGRLRPDAARVSPSPCAWRLGSTVRRRSPSNEKALNDGSRILSAYVTGNRKKIWIITEVVNDHGLRASTTILLPEEY